MIRLALAIVLFAIPAAILAAIILSIFPHISKSIFVLVCAGSIIGGALMYIRKRKRQFVEQGNIEEMPTWLTKTSYRVFLIAGTLLGTFAMFSFNKTELYIDNGSDKAVNISLKYADQFTVQPHSYVSKTVVMGDNEVTYNGKTKVFKVVSRGKWLWNIDTINSYVKSSLSYSSEEKLYRNSKDIPKEKSPEFEFINGEFFNAKVDYMFDAPKTISVKRTESIGDVAKTVLYRLNGNDFLDDSDSTDTNNSVKE